MNRAIAVELHPAPAPIWCLPHVSPGRLARRDSHKERCPWQSHHPPCLLLPCPIAAAYCRCGMCSLSSGWSHAGASLPWFWPLFPVCTSAISQQTKMPADSTQESVMQFLGPPNPAKPMADCTGLSWKSFTLPVNGEHMYNSICNLWKYNTQKPSCQDKVEEKQNHCFYNPVFISANLPSKPPVLQAVFYYTVHKEEKKNVNKKNWPLRLPIHSTFPILYSMTALWTCLSARILHTHCPKELKGNREKKKGEDLYPSCCCQKLSYEPIRKTRGHRRTRCSMLHRFWFWLSSPEMPPAHSNNQACLSGLKLLSKGTTKHSFWLKPQKNSL